MKSNDLYHYSDAGSRKYVFYSCGPGTWRRGVVSEIVETRSELCDVVSGPFIQAGIVECFRATLFKTGIRRRGRRARVLATRESGRAQTRPNKLSVIPLVGGI